MRIRDEAEREKRNAALASVAAAVLLTAMKLLIGLSTNSLGILSEAAHSALDLLAAAVTYAAVRYAAFPPDTSHPYGHGKMENLAALVESLLLLITCGWIVWEAMDRLFWAHTVATPSLWGVGVMAVSIVVDVSRSRMLLRAAKKYRSQALEADAIHFSTDILSSAVVIVGLLALFAAEALPESSELRPWLERADALAALGVAAIVVHISVKLGRQAVNILLDAGDEPVAAAIRAALEKITAIQDIIALRLRHSGPELFVDLSLGVGKGQRIDEIEDIRVAVECAVHSVAEHAEIHVAFVPHTDANEAVPDPIMRLRGIAAMHGLAPHAVELLDLEADDTGQHYLAELHVEFPPEMPLEEAHARVCVFENAVRAEKSDIIIVTHIEPMGERGEEKIALAADFDRIKAVVRRIVAGEPLVGNEHNVLVSNCGNGRRLSFHCRMAPETTVGEAHAVSMRLQTALYSELPELSRVIVHMEPFRD